VLVSTYLLGEMVPMQARRDSGEPILASLQQKFQIAPASLLAGAAGPAPPVSKPANPPPSASRPLVLIVVDALRRDRMGVYNPELANTPFLSGLASAGQLQTFDAYATCTFSFCGMMSILASRSWNDFGSRPDTIVDRLHDHSYSSHLVLSGQHSKFGNFLNLLAKSATIADQPRGEQPSDLWALGALQRLKIEQPRHSFIYLHLMSAHAGSFIEPKYRVTPDDEGHLGAYLFSRHGKASYREIYDKRVAQADDVIRRAFSLLRDKGMLDDALIIITSDHGQRIAEGGRLYHGGDADPATLNIPLLVVDPRRAALPPRFPASQIDIAPTFAKAIGVTPGAGWKGEALQAPSRRVAVPVGTAESTGAVVRVGGGVALFLCHRRTGKETVYAGGKAAGHRPDLPRLRRLHLQASAPVRDRACNATGATASASAAT
jgi:membrane-anchored protein YejM (alkaline phosphatase superfamily)